jgi:hypothetical protein
LKERIKVAQAERKRQEEIEFKAKQDKIKKKEKKRMQAEIAKAVERATYAAAEVQVRAKEARRQADERVEITHKIFAGEEKRNRWWIATAIAYVIVVVGICVFLSPWYILLGAIVAVTIIAGVVIYKAYHFPIVEPTVIDESDLLHEIAQLQLKMKKESEEKMKEKDAKFLEQLKKEKAEAKRRKAAQKEKARYEAELLEQSRLQRVKVAQEAQRRVEALKAGAVGSEKQQLDCVVEVMDEECKDESLDLVPECSSAEESFDGSSVEGDRHVEAEENADDNPQPVVVEEV